MPTVVVGLDFSQASRKALDGAVSLASSLGARLVLVHAQPGLPPGAKPGHLDPVTQLKQEISADEAMRLSTEWAARARERLDDVESVTREGRAAEAVLAEARERKADYIVVGSHGRTGLRRVVLGSVAEAVVRNSSVPVLVVPS